MDWGMKNRMAQVTKSDGKCFFLPIDHGYFLGPTSRLERPGETIKPILSYADALFVTRGVLRNAIDPMKSKPIILRVSGGTSVIGGDLANEELTTSVEEAIRLNAMAVGMSIFVGTEYEGSSKYISRIPELAGGLDLIYSPGDWDFSFGADWAGEMYIDYGSTVVKTDSYWVCNARAAKTFPEHGFEVFAGAKNLFDEVQKDRRTDDAAFIYKPLTGLLVYTGAKFQF